jgi:hypothetical protein
MKEVMQMSANKYVLVKTITTFEHSYLIPLQEEQSIKDHLDYITCKEIDETSQLFLDETILMNSTRLLSEDEAIELFDRENDYLKNWSREKKLEWIQKQFENPNFTGEM